MATRKPRRSIDELPAHRQRIYRQERCTDFDDLIAQAAAHGKPVTIRAWPDGTPLTSEQDCWDLINKLRCTRAGRQWTIRRGQPDGLGPQLDGDQWTARIRVLSKAEGQNYIAGRIERGEPVLFNPAVPRASGKYICPQCHHRRSAAPKTLCLDCVQHQATAASRQFAREAAEAARRTWGQAWDDPANWDVDHALAPPRTPREQADRPVAEQARDHIGLEDRIRQRTGQLLDWQEHAPGRPAPKTVKGKLADIPRNLRDQARAGRDTSAAEKLDGPHGEKIRQLLDEWTNGKHH